MRRLVDEIVWVKMTVNRRLAKSHGYYLQHAKEVRHPGQAKSPDVCCQPVLPHCRICPCLSHADVKLMLAAGHHCIDSYMDIGICQLALQTAGHELGMHYEQQWAFCPTKIWYNGRCAWWVRRERTRQVLPNQWAVTSSMQKGGDRARNQKKFTSWWKSWSHLVCTLRY